MLLSLRKNGLTSLFKEVRAFKEEPSFSPTPSRQPLLETSDSGGREARNLQARVRLESNKKWKKRSVPPARKSLVQKPWCIFFPNKRVHATALSNSGHAKFVSILFAHSTKVALPCNPSRMPNCRVTAILMCWWIPKMILIDRVSCYIYIYIYICCGVIIWAKFWPFEVLLSGPSLLFTKHCLSKNTIK